MIGVESKMVQEEEAKPVTLWMEKYKNVNKNTKEAFIHIVVHYFANYGMTADGVVLVGYPDDEYDVECRGGVVEEHGHDGLHADERQYDGEQRRGRKRHRHVHLDHLEQVDDEQEDLMMRVAQQDGYGDGEEDHDEQGADVRRARHPRRDEAKVLARDGVAHEALVLLLLGQILYVEHEYLVVAEYLVEHEAIEAGAEAGVAARIQRHQHDRDIQTLTRLRRQPQEAVLERILDNIVLLDWRTGKTKSMWQKSEDPVF